MKAKIKLEKKQIWYVLFLFLTFQTAIIVNTKEGSLFYTVMNYADEIIVVSLFLITIAKYKFEVHLLPFERRMLLFLVIFEIMGITTGIYYQYQEIKYMILDAFQSIKFILLYYSARLLTKDRLDDKFFLPLNNLVRVFAVILLVLGLHDVLLSPWWPTYDFRYFVNTISLFFNHPENLSRCCMALIFVLAYNYRYYKHNIYYIFMLSAVILFAFRAKAVLALFVFFAVFIYFVKLRFQNLIPAGIAGVAGIAYLGKDAFSHYYRSTEFSVRQKLTEDSIKIANQYFPVGTGFGSFGTNSAIRHYSKLYVKMGYLYSWEMGPRSHYMNDTFWPSLFAQTGWFGTAAFAIALLNLLDFIIRSRKKDVYFFWVAISILAYDVISSAANTAFFHPSAMAPYLFLGLIMSIYVYPKKVSN